MAAPWTLTLDCADVPALAAFWAAALGYTEKPPPAGWDTWPAFFRDQGVPESEWSDVAALEDPDGVLPPLSLLKVPEPKTAKNRLHLDLQVSGGRHRDQAERERLIRGRVAELVELGATVGGEIEGPNGLDHVMLQDPEGNEFCVV